MNPKKITIAIDGYSSCGKSTMARALAANIGYRYIDSGAMYRAVTLYALRHNMIDGQGDIDADAVGKAAGRLDIDFAVVPGGQHTMLDGEDVETEIRSMEVASHVSAIAALPAVRHALTERMQEIGRSKGIVMDGRDIGTTVFPDAEMKVFVTANPRVRARRRFDELKAKGMEPDFGSVLANVEERDRLDTTRKESPLRKAADAVVLDNSDMTLKQQERWLIDLFDSTTGQDR